MPIKEQKAETEIHPVILEAKVKKFSMSCTNIFRLFANQFILLYFFQGNKFLFYQYFLM